MQHTQWPYYTLMRGHMTGSPLEDGHFNDFIITYSALCCAYFLHKVAGHPQSDTFAFISWWGAVLCYQLNAVDAHSSNQASCATHTNNLT